MKLLLFLILLTMGEAAYIASSIQQQTFNACLEQASNWQDKIDSLQGENKRLTDTKTSLVNNIGAVESQISALNQQINGGGTGPGPAAVVENKDPIPEVNSNLGTITTVDGKKFENCQLLKIEQDGITFNHSEGITKILYANLPLDIQHHFHADPQSRAATEAAKLRYEEQVRQAQGAAESSPSSASASSSAATAQ